MGVRKVKYMISLPFEEAVREAKEMNLKRNEWVYINPFDIGNDTQIRQRQIQGRRASSPKYLIGKFTTAEKKILLRGWRKMVKDRCIEILSSIIVDANCSIEHMKETGKDIEGFQEKIDALKYAKKIIKEKS